MGAIDGGGGITSRIDEMLARAALPQWRDRTAAMRAAFEARTGAFSPSDAIFEARSAAFWDDALTRGAFGREIETEISEGARLMIEPLARGHRGLFRVDAAGDEFLLVDEWSGAEFVARPTTAGLREALACATSATLSASLVDGRVIGEGGRVWLLSGALFHAADALGPIRALLSEARARKLATHDFLDALLRMDHALRSLSRVKVAFAYRKEALRV